MLAGVCVCARLCVSVVCVGSPAAIPPDCKAQRPGGIGLLFASSSLQCCGSGCVTGRPGQLSSGSSQGAKGCVLFKPGQGEQAGSVSHSAHWPSALVSRVGSSAMQAFAVTALLLRFVSAFVQLSLGC